MPSPPATAASGKNTICMASNVWPLVQASERPLVAVLVEEHQSYVIDSEVVLRLASMVDWALLTWAAEAMPTTADTTPSPMAPKPPIRRQFVGAPSPEATMARL